jgi:hypothetical protein
MKGMVLTRKVKFDSIPANKPLLDQLHQSRWRVFPSLLRHLRGLLRREAAFAMWGTSAAQRAGNVWSVFAGRDVQKRDTRRPWLRQLPSLPRTTSPPFPRLDISSTPDVPIFRRRQLRCQHASYADASAKPDDVQSRCGSATIEAFSMLHVQALLHTGRSSHTTRESA